MLRAMCADGTKCRQGSPDAQCATSWRAWVQDAQDAQDAESRLGESGRKTRISDAGHLFADGGVPCMAAAIAGRAPGQLFCLGLTKFLISCLRVQILRSTGLFRWWWYWVAIQTWLPRDFIICHQNLEVKRESWSRTRLKGRPSRSMIVLLSF